MSNIIITKNKEYTFAIDCDEVLRSLLKNMVSLYNREFNDNMSVNDIKDFMVDVSFPRIKERTGESASKWFFQDHSTQLFKESEALPKIKQAINILKKYGRVIIVTYQKTYQNKTETLQWLETNGIEPDGICFLKDKTLLHCDFLIDDNDWNFLGCNCENGILITAPYNKNISIEELMEKNNCKNMYRFDSLYNFAKTIKY